MKRVTSFSLRNFLPPLAAAALVAAGAGSWFSPARAADALPIIVYHQIRVGTGDPPDGDNVISLERFEAQMRHLHEQGYRALGMDEVMSFLAGQPFPEKLVAIHFDDGWKSSQHAVPVLERYGMKASFWISAGTGIGSPHMDWQEIEALSRQPGMELYSHSMSHPWRDGDTLVDWVEGRTPGKGAEDAHRELAESRRVLEQKLARAIPYLAWPRGAYNESLIRLASQAGYTALLTIDDGFNRPGDDPLRIKRVMVDGRCGDAVFREILGDGMFRPCPGEGSPPPSAPSARH